MVEAQLGLGQAAGLEFMRNIAGAEPLVVKPTKV